MFNFDHVHVQSDYIVFLMPLFIYLFLNTALLSIKISEYIFVSYIDMNWFLLVACARVTCAAVFWL